LNRIRASLFAAVLPFLGGPAAALDVDVSTFKLGNGIQVVVIPDHRAPVVTHMVWYRVGSADEPYGTSGIAHFLEHLMFKGTAKFPIGRFDEIIRLNGAEDNAFTTKDYTAYFQKVAKDRLPLMMELEADRMQNLVLTDNEVLPERQVIIEERRERTDNEPSALLGEQMDAAMYLAHPYGKPIIGWKQEMEKLSRADALSFYKAHYTPSNAIVVVAGDVTRDEVAALAETFYGGLKNSFVAGARTRAEEPPPIAARRVTLKDARAASPLVQRNYLAPSYAHAEGLEGEALDLLAEILGGGSASILYKKLVVEQKIAAYAGAWYSGDGLDHGSFGLYGAPNPGGDITALEAAIDAALEEVLKNGVSEEQLVTAKSKSDVDTVYALDNQASLARIFGVALTTGLTVEDVLSSSADIQKVTVADVKAAAAKVLDIRRSVTGVLLPDGNGAQATAPALPANSNSLN
jgi:zinc protease